MLLQALGDCLGIRGGSRGALGGIWDFNTVYEGPDRLGDAYFFAKP